jgi:hypothetical protein
VVSDIGAGTPDMVERYFNAYVYLMLVNAKAKRGLFTGDLSLQIHLQQL